MFQAFPDTVLKKLQLLNDQLCYSKNGTKEMGSECIYNVRHRFASSFLAQFQLVSTEWTSSMLDQKATRKKCWVGHRVQRLQQGLREERCTISYIDCTVCIIVATQHIINCGSKHVEKASTAQWRQASKTCVKDIFKLQNSLVFSGATTMWPYLLEANGMILIIQLLV